MMQAFLLPLDETAGPGRSGGVNSRHALHVDDADRHYAEWKPRVQIDRAPVDEPWDARTFGVTDPSGNTIFVIGPPRKA